jgi:hypothetical protein
LVSQQAHLNASFEEGIGECTIGTFRNEERNIVHRSVVATESSFVDVGRNHGDLRHVGEDVAVRFEAHEFAIFKGGGTNFEFDGVVVNLGCAVDGTTSFGAISQLRQSVSAGELLSPL